MEVDKNLTFVLTLKDRAPFTFRWMTYSNKISFPFKILIADGGRDSTVEEKLSKKDNFPNLNYEYIRYPYDKTFSEYFAKLADIVLRVKTPYVVLGDDDDFFLVEGLRKSVKFLQDNPDYAICGGRIAKFEIFPDASKPYGKNSDLTLLADVDSLKGRTSMERVQTHFSQLISTFYDIHRTADQIKNFKTLQDLDFKDLMFMEYLTSFSIIAKKKSKRESYLYLLRQINPIHSSSAEHKQLAGDDFDRMLKDSWSKDFTAFIREIAQCISEQDGINFNDAQKFLKKEYRKFIAPIIVNCLKQEAMIPRKAIIAVPSTKSSKWKKGAFIKKTLRPLYHWFQDKTSSLPRPRPITRSSKLYKEVKPILDFLKSEN